VKDEGSRITESAGDGEEVQVEAAKTPDTPTAEEIDRHNISHLPYRGWCRHCVLGRGKNTAHSQLEAEKQHVFPTIMHDYGFLGKEARAHMPMLVSKSSRTLRIDADIVPSKGGESEYSIEVMSNAIRNMGHSKFVHKSDQERCPKNLMKSTVQHLGTAVEAVPEDSPVGEHQSNGAMENGVMQIEGLVRSHRDALEVSQGVTVTNESPLVPWLVKWAAFVYNRFSRDVNGKCPMRKRRVNLSVGS
jgi:hypothetical protein